MMPPRAQLTTRTPGFMRAISRAPSMFSVSSETGTWTVTTSALARARLDVDVVHAHAGAAEKAETAGVAEELRVHRGGRARDDGLVLRDGREELRPGHLRRYLLHLEAPLLEVHDPFGSNGVDDQYTHVLMLSREAFGARARAAGGW